MRTIIMKQVIVATAIALTSPITALPANIDTANSSFYNEMSIINVLPSIKKRCKKLNTYRDRKATYTDNKGYKKCIQVITDELRRIYSRDLQDEANRAIINRSKRDYDRRHSK